MKTLSECAESLVALLNKRQFVEAYQELFDSNAESIDPTYSDQPPMKGLDLLIERERSFLSRAEIHSIDVSAPLLSGNYFVINLKMVFTVMGQKKILEELCVYQFDDGKITSQQFFISKN
jgi:hypothetical protein